MDLIKKRKQIRKIIIGALRETIRAHGPINARLIGSAAKRITNTLLASKKKNENLHSNTI